MGIALYSPEDVIILLGGVYPITGLHEGTFLSISEESNKFTTSVTADGRVSRTHMNVPIHRIELTLSSLADANTLFTTWAFADGKLYGAMLPMYIKDGMGSTLFYSPMTWIESAPSVSFSEGVEARTWVLKSAGGVSSVGGNGELSQSVLSDLAGIGLIAADFAGIL